MIHIVSFILVTWYCKRYFCLNLCILVIKIPKWWQWWSTVVGSSCSTLAQSCSSVEPSLAFATGTTSEHQRVMWPGIYRKLIEFLRIVVWHMKVSACLLEVRWLECSCRYPSYKVNFWLFMPFLIGKARQERWGSLTCYDLMFLLTRVSSLCHQLVRC